MHVTFGEHRCLVYVGDGDGDLNFVVNCGIVGTCGIFVIGDANHHLIDGLGFNVQWCHGSQLSSVAINGKRRGIGATGGITEAVSQWIVFGIRGDYPPQDWMGRPLIVFSWDHTSGHTKGRLTFIEHRWFVYIRDLDDDYD